VQLRTHQAGGCQDEPLAFIPIDIGVVMDVDAGNKTLQFESSLGGSASIASVSLPGAYFLRRIHQKRRLRVGSEGKCPDICQIIPTLDIFQRLRQAVFGIVGDHDHLRVRPTIALMADFSRIVASRDFVQFFLQSVGAQRLFGAEIGAELAGHLFAIDRFHPGLHKEGDAFDRHFLSGSHIGKLFTGFGETFAGIRQRDGQRAVTRFHIIRVCPDNLLVTVAGGKHACHQQRE